VLFVLGHYSPQKIAPGWHYAAKLMAAVLLGGILAGAVGVVGTDLSPRPTFLAANIPLLFGLLWCSRQVKKYVFLRRGPPKRLAIVGDLPGVAGLVKELCRQRFPDYKTGPVCLQPSRASSDSPIPDIPLNLELCESLGALLERGDFEVLAIDTACTPLCDDQVRRILELSVEGVEVEELARLHKEIAGRPPPDHISSRSVVELILDRGPTRRPYRAAKRALDVGLSSAALVLCFVPMAIIALMIKLESSGPVCIVQERLGYRRRPFACIKFRTMAHNAEMKTGPVWASRGDPRVTRVGAFLRRTRLDELPQFLNVLRGEMSLVGPRPIRAYFADLLAKEVPFYDLRFAVRPGLTGWAQVYATYAASTEDQEKKFRYDLFYLENCSLLLDSYILLKTIRVVVKGGGA
jgi:exopolysaccharide biosynthesis polyprenyl glycosylphosphotransferase